jgi:hypothetical protein
MTGKERRNARSTLERRILVSGNETHVDEKFPKKELETLWAPRRGAQAMTPGIW